MEHSTPQDYLLYIDDILSSIDNIESDISQMSFEDLVQDQKTARSIILSFVIIGEAVRKIPQQFLAQYSDIPWAQVISFRNTLVHEYWIVDEEILYEIIKKDMPKLKGVMFNIKRNSAL
jgi:uncharacterized protein with HEPN domain